MTATAFTPLTLVLLLTLAVPALAGAGTEPTIPTLPDSWRGVPLGATKDQVNTLLPQEEDALDVVDTQGEVSRMVRGHGEGDSYTEHMVQFYKGKAFSVGHYEYLDAARTRARLIEYQTAFGAGEGDVSADAPGSHSWDDGANGRVLIMVWEHLTPEPGSPTPMFKGYEVLTMLIDGGRASAAEAYLAALEAVPAGE